MIRIYIESKNKSTPEYKFIDTLLHSMEIDASLYEIIPLNGKDTLHLAKNQFLQNTAEGGRNLIVFDADSEENLGGYDRRKEEIETQLQELEIKADIFLWPNDQDDGDFETLLESIARKDLHSQFFDCFNDYEACLGREYLKPNRKGKLHTYVTSMNLNNSQRRNIGSGDWLFKDKKLWDMDSPSLNQIKEFLNSNI
ncbi:MAG: hypothetical protein K2K25_13145 [Muribaculaceae bacterium]|nr:hypothetical protein [Muribaculaceae bacterium]